MLGAEMIYSTNTEALLDLAPRYLPKNQSVMDLGCGCGDFLAAFGNASGGSLTGLDQSKEMLELGRKKHPRIEFIRGDIRKAHKLKRNFDAVFMTSTHSIFPDIDSWLYPITRITDGAAFVLGLFNPEPFDTITRWRKHGGAWSEGGYNLWSVRSVAEHLDRLNCKHEFIQLDMDTSFIESLPSDYPMTFRRATMGGPHHLVNGLQLFCTYYLLVITPQHR